MQADVPLPTSLSACAHQNSSVSFVFAGNSGHYNRGCQALERGTHRILEHSFGSISVDSFARQDTLEFDRQMDGETRSAFPLPLAHGRYHPVRLVNSVLTRANPRLAWRAARPLYAGAAPLVQRCAAVLAIGGDNYSLDYGRPDSYMAFNEFVLGINRGGPLVLWGCSIGPFVARSSYERSVARQLRETPLILAREDATVEYLDSIGVRDNVKRVADPAFAMEPVAPQHDVLDSCVEPGSIGINLSPLMAQFAGLSVMGWTRLAIDAVRNLLDHVDRPVALIPHVVYPAHNDDHAFLSVIAREIGSSRVSVLSRELDAPELKHVIGQCDIFIGARTHATIAALGQCVPCGFIAYSTKAYGISRDVLGAEDTVVAIERFDETSLVRLADSLLEDEVSTRTFLQHRIPAVRQQAYHAGVLLRELVGEHVR